MMEKKRGRGLACGLPGGGRGLRDFLGLFGGYAELRPQGAKIEANRK